MNKRIFFKLGLVLLSLSLVACGQKNNSEDNNHEDMHQDTQLNIEQYTQEESTEDEYYTIIKEAWQKQKDYIKSILYFFSSSAIFSAFFNEWNPIFFNPYNCCTKRSA